VCERECVCVSVSVCMRVQLCVCASHIAEIDQFSQKRGPLEALYPVSTRKNGVRAKENTDETLWERIFHRATCAAGKSGRITGSSYPARFSGCDPVIRHDFPAVYVARRKMRSHKLDG